MRKCKKSCVSDGYPIFYSRNYRARKCFISQYTWILILRILRIIHATSIRHSLAHVLDLVDLVDFWIWWCGYFVMFTLYMLTHWGRDKMAAIFQTTFSDEFSWMKMYKFRLKFHWNLFPRVQLTIFQHWFRKWLGAGQATSHYLKQWWLVYWRIYAYIYASRGLNELTVHGQQHSFSTRESIFMRSHEKQTILLRQKMSWGRLEFIPNTLIVWLRGPSALIQITA